MLQVFKGQIGVQFHDEGLLRQALTHRSYVNEHEDEGLKDNERLEFLGDAVLDFLTGDYLFQKFPDMPEGELTRLRAALVRTESLASLAAQIDLGAALFMGRGEESSGGRERLNNLCSGFEALVGALYLDQGLAAVGEFIIPRFEPLLQEVLDEALNKDARSQLQEWSQAELSITPVYRTTSATGPDHDKEFQIEVIIGDRVVGQGVGKSKQAASQAAARAALELLARERNQM
jgi:ribonuclease-3